MITTKHQGQGKQNQENSENLLNHFHCKFVYLFIVFHKYNLQFWQKITIICVVPQVENKNNLANKMGSQ
jgi:hypothetical protein